MVPRECYIGFRCRICDSPIPLFHDPSQGKAAFAGPGRLHVTCRNCGQADDYGTDETQRFRLDVGRLN